MTDSSTPSSRPDETDRMPGEPDRVPGEPDLSPDDAPGAAGGKAAPPPEKRKRRARWLYARVIAVQVLALIALWLLQATYGS